VLEFLHSHAICYRNTKPENTPFDQFNNIQNAREFRIHRNIVDTICRSPNSVLLIATMFSLTLTHSILVDRNNLWSSDRRFRLSLWRNNPQLFWTPVRDRYSFNDKSRKWKEICEIPGLLNGNRSDRGQGIWSWKPE
jgi:hypothetical protein